MMIVPSKRVALPIKLAETAPAVIFADVWREKREWEAAAFVVGKFL